MVFMANPRQSAYPARPKRKIKRRIFAVSHNLGSSVGDVIMLTLSRDETLIRTIIDLTFVNFGNAGGQFEFLLDRHPLGVNVAPVPVIAEAVRDDVSLNEVYRFKSNITKGDDTGDDGAVHLYRDIKSQRLFHESDLYNYADLASAASQIRVDGVIVTFWKQV